ncbi:MAG TPA: LD-carboxypeptidase [Candidatus Stackebrandtia faecavium]|nr:LD-carboxypeptidase [Candidatus Stackebrandtia faecavium]
MSTAHYPAKPEVGDRVAIVSPSGGALPHHLPMPYELGLARLRDEFGLEPVEYPATRSPESTPRQRAEDLHAAFSDPDITAVICSIGGDDQITVLPYLDADLLSANPKPFFGFSDATNMLAYLASIGLVGYHGGAIMTAFGRPQAMHELTRESLRAALFTRGEYELRPAGEFTDTGKDWAEASTFESAPEMFAGDGWTWRNAESAVSGRAWGGCLEIASWLAMADVAVPDLEYFDNAVLVFETSEEMPAAEDVYRILRNFGERGILGRCRAFVMGRPKAWSFAHPNTPREREEFCARQREAVCRALDEYAPGILTVMNLDIGHTDPQLIIPYGGDITVDGVQRRITVTY